jgi:tryptophan synthase alpha chain
VKTLVVYLMAMPDTPALAEAAVEAGADVIELGFPFSDPLADGPLIRRAGERALAAGMRTARCLEVLAETRSRIDVPLIPMTYASIFEAYGWAELERDARAGGATSLIVPDLPVDARPELRRVQLVAPTSTDERLRLSVEATDGWLYLVTVTGTTGARAELAPTLAPLAARTRAWRVGPLAAGFGTSPRAHARAAAELVDGVVVGSAAVAAAEQGAGELTRLVTELRSGLDGIELHA